VADDGKRKREDTIYCVLYIIRRKRRNRINNMSANHLHIPASLFLLLSVGSVPAAAVDIRGRGWQVAWTTTFAALDIHV